jgi:hypothetical protein
VLPSFDEARREIFASVAQLAEQRFCKPQVVGSSPTAGFSVARTVICGQQIPDQRTDVKDSFGLLHIREINRYLPAILVGREVGVPVFRVKMRVFRQLAGVFQSGQMGQTVNLVAKPSQVRILPPPLLF